MKNILTGSIIFAVGAAIGVGCSYKYFEKKFGDIADAEIESVKMVARNNRMKAEVGELNTSNESSGEYSDDEITRVVFTPDIETMKESSQYEKEEDLKKHNDISASYKTKEADNKIRENKQRTNYNEISDNKIIEMAKGADLSKQEAIVISAKSFVEDCLDYDKLTLNYYEGNGVLLDDHNDVFVDFEDYIGRDTLDQFGAFGVGDNLVYVRNDKWESDYEIIKFDESYEE